MSSFRICRQHIGEIIYSETGADICPACWEIKRLKDRLEVRELTASEQHITTENNTVEPKQEERA